jgi:hypothetical protein
MIPVPVDLRPLLNDILSSVGREATARRLVIFFAAAILVIGNRTVSSVVRLLSLIESVNPSTYHRLFSHRKWLPVLPAKVIARFVVRRLVPQGPITLVGDETVDGHRGKKVYGKARHRDAVRSSHSHTVFRYGHKWIVLAILVQFPYTNRPFALPVLVALYRDKKTCQAEETRQKTAAELMRGLLATFVRWFPDRKIRFSGDNAYGSQAMARFAARHHQRLTLVSKIVPDANLFAAPPRRRRTTSGRPPIKGRSLPSPKEVAQSGKRGKKLRVRWYGGGWRNVRVFTDVGHWYKSGKGLVEIRWVYVIDLDGTHRDECFFTTDVSMKPEAIIELYGGRWNIETTFQEMREHLGLETTRGWTRNTVLRMAPCLFLLYTVIVMFYNALPDNSPHVRYRSWANKEQTTFSDMIMTVRHYLWIKWVFAQVPGGAAVQKLPPRIRSLLDFGLLQAA